MEIVHFLNCSDNQKILRMRETTLDPPHEQAQILGSGWLSSSWWYTLDPLLAFYILFKSSVTLPVDEMNFARVHRLAGFLTQRNRIEGD